MKESKQKLLAEDELELHEMEAGHKGNLKLPPGWVAISDDITYDISRIKTKSTR